MIQLTFAEMCIAFISPRPTSTAWDYTAVWTDADIALICAEAETKTCSCCKATLPIHSFYLLRRGDRARQARCRLCDNTARAFNMWRMRAEDRKRMRARGPDAGRVVVERLADGSLVMTRKGPER